MTDTHDTTDGLLAEFRGYAAGMPPSYHVTMSWHDFRKMLDRFDAAHDHDIALATEASARAVVGACVKQQEAERKCVALREALEAALKTIRGVINSTISPRSNTVFDCRDKMSAALAVPMRNCDRYATLPDALAAWRDVDPREAGTFDEWLFAPATEKEGGAK